MDYIDIRTAQCDWGNGEVMLYKFKSGVNAYLSKVKPNVPVHSLDDVTTYTQEHQDIAMKYSQDVFIQSNATSGTLTEPQYLTRLLVNLRMARDKGINAALQKHDVDALFFPSFYRIPYRCESWLLIHHSSCGVYFCRRTIWNHIYRLSFTEHLLIKLAYSFEQATNHRVPPGLK